MVVDAKYKPQYKKGNISKDDIRQVSGYARMKSVYKELEMQNKHSEVIDCLIIYSDQNAGQTNFINVDLKESPESKYVNFYKVGIELPVI